ncbi:MAG TPA: VC0807 family protein [Stellaceae bacterium]|nr:VC0807 family protein [Stellaceae bacterium]
MLQAAAGEPSPPAPAARPLPLPPLRALVADVALPWASVQLMERVWHAPPVRALAVAAVFPLLSILFSWARRRRLDLIGAAVLVTILGGIAVALLAHDARFAVLKAAPAFGLFGIACLSSLGRRRPLMFFVAREFRGGGDAAERAAWEARLEIPRFRRSMQLLTLVWGAAALAESIFGIAAAFLLPISAALVAEPMLGIGTVAGLLFWTAGFARRREAAR